MLCVDLRLKELKFDYDKRVTTIEPTKLHYIIRTNRYKLTIWRHWDRSYLLDNVNDNVVVDRTKTWNKHIAELGEKMDNIQKLVNKI